MNSNGGKGCNFDENLLLEQCRLAYEESETNRANLHRYALAGFSGLMVIAGLLATQGDKLLQAKKENPYILLILLIYPLIGASYSMVVLPFFGRVILSKVWLVHHLKYLREQSSVLSSKTSFFQTFNTREGVWKGLPKRLAQSEIASSFVFWAIMLYTSIFCYVAYFNLARRGCVFAKLPFLITFLFSLIVFIFCTAWEIITVIKYFKKRAEFHREFRNKICAKDGENK